MADHDSPTRDTDALRYLEQRPPIIFPETEKVPESQLHMDTRIYDQHAGRVRTWKV